MAVPLAVRRLPIRFASPRRLLPRPRAASTLLEGAVFEWERFRIPYDVCGESAGATLCLPSINIASTRNELRPLTRLLAPVTTSYVCDWPGFGDASRLNVAYSPELFLSFVLAFVETVVQKSEIRVVACGQAAGYALRLAQQRPSLFSHIALIAPTYKSPSRAMGMHPVAASMLRGLIKSPLGELIYSRVTQPDYFRRQYESHVFKDASKITDAFLQERLEVVKKTGGRFGPASSFTGQLDAIQDRRELIDMAEAVECPLKIIYGQSSPKSSLAEMEALEARPKLDVCRMEGALGLVEESPNAIAELLIPFLEGR